MTEQVLPPLPAIGSAIIQIFGPDPSAPKWDQAVWDDVAWAKLDWRDITPESMQCQVTWGADDPAGVLTTPAAGSWLLNVYDPRRWLDPSNGASPYAASIRPGRPFRIMFRSEGRTDEVVRIGLIDEIEFDIMTLTGNIRGTDGITHMVSAVLPAGQDLDTAMPGTLRARVEYLLKKAGVDKLVHVETSPDLPEQPPVEEVPESVNDGSFEVVDNDTNKDLVHWNGSSTQFARGQPEATAPDGTHVLEINGGGQNWPEQWQDSSVNVKGDTLYRLSARMQNVSGPTGGYIRVEALDASELEKEHIPGQVAATVVATLHNDLPGWNEKSVEFTTPPGTVAFRINCQINAAPASDTDLNWWDMVSIKEVVETSEPPPEIEEPLFDPPVGKPIADEANLWSHIGQYARDALYAVWMDRKGFLRFRSYATARDNGLQAGGDGGIPISSLNTQASLGNVYTHVEAFDVTAPDVSVIAEDSRAEEIYGDIIFKRDRPVPDARWWVDSVLADRAGASLQYIPGTLYPQTREAFMACLTAGMVDILHIVADDVEPNVNVAARIIGGFIRCDTGTGWTVGFESYIPARDWDEQEVPPPIEPPVEPPPGEQTQKVTRYYDARADTRAARSSGGANYGSGTEPELPVGAWQGWRNRAFIDFNDIPFGDVVSVDAAWVELDTTDQVNVGFGSSPKVTVKRVTESWSEGSLSSPGSANSTVYPGPSCTSSGAVTKAITRSENAAVSIGITAIARAWFGGSKQQGIGIFSAGEDSTTYTTEFHSREHGTSSKRPRLKLEMTVRI